MSACTRTRSPTQRLMGNFPLSTSGSTLSITTRRSVLTVRLIRVAGVSNASSPKEACPGKWLGSQVGCATRGAQTPSQLYIGPRPRFTQRVWACALVHGQQRRRLLAVRDPDVLHLRSMVQEPAAFALFDAEPVDGPAFIAEDLLQIPHRQRLRNSTAGLACKRPDGVYIVMLRQDFQQLGAAPGNQVDHTAGQVAGFKNLVQVANDERVSL